MAVNYTDEDKFRLAQMMAGNRTMNFPGVRQSYMDDPRTKLGQNMLEQGQNTAPVAAGGWGLAEGLSRLGFGAFGGKMAGEQLRSYQDQAQQQSQEFARLYGGEQAAQQQMGSGNPMDLGVGPQAMQGPDPNMATAQALSAPPGAPQVNPRSPLSRALPGQGQTQLPQPPAPQLPARATAVPSGGAVGAGSSSRVSSGTARNTGINPDIIAARKIVGDSEGPMNAGGYNAIAYNTPDGRNAAGVERVPLTQMTIGQVLNFQRGPMRAKTRGFRGEGDVGSTGVGRYQFESNTLEERAKKVFGANYKNIPFTRANQDALFDSHYSDHAKAGTLGTQWNILRGGDGTRTSVSVSDRTSTPMYGPEDIEIPELPGEPVRPDMPEIAQSAPSKRRLLAERLMAGGDAMFPIMMANLEAGMGEEADLNKQREENIAQMQSLGYQTDMQTYGSMRGNRYEQQLAERKAAIDARYKAMEGMTEHEREVELENMRQQGAEAAARIRAAPDPYDPNKPHITKLITQFGNDRNTAVKMADNALAAFEIAQTLEAGGYNALSPVKAVRQAYSNKIAQIEQLRKAIVLDQAGGKLGAAISDADRNFIEGTVFDIGKDPKAIRTYLRRLISISQRAQQYNQHAAMALGNGTYPQFQAEWGDYINDTPLQEKNGVPVPWGNVAPFDVWKEMRDKKEMANAVFGN